MSVKWENSDSPKVYWEADEVDAIYFGSDLAFTHADLPQQPQRFTISPVSSTSNAPEIITIRYRPSENVESEIIVNIQGQDTTVFTRQFRAPRTQDYTTTFTVRADQDATFTLYLYNDEGTTTVVKHYTWLVAGSIISFGPISYGAQIPVAGGGVQIPISLPLRVAGKTLESAILSRPGMRDLDLIRSHQFAYVTPPYELSGTFHDTLYVGSGVVTYTLTIIVNGITTTQSISTRNL